MVNRTAQRETVIGVFNDQMTAQRAIERLKDAGFAPSDIGILMQNQQGAQNLAAQTGTKAGEDAGKGAVAGGLLGALGGLLVGVGALAIPGIGPVVAAGPLAAGLGAVLGSTATGAVVGAGVGAIAGALIGMGVPENEARVYEDRFRQGRILVTVKAGFNRYDEAWRILRNAGAEDINFNNPQYGTQPYTNPTV
ncbi:MAG TPA: general stress protein [Chloroflexia bacterium]